MKKQNTWEIIVNTIIIVLAVVCAATAILLAFKAQFMIDFEYHVNTVWGWSKFNLLAAAVVGLIVLGAAETAVLVVVDDKEKKAVAPKRARKDTFK